REALGIVEQEEEEEEEEEEEQRKSLRLIEESGKALAKLLFHGSQLVSDVRVEMDLREVQRREREAEEKRKRMERLEKESQRSAETFEEISSRWALARDTRVPQELRDLLREQQEECEKLLGEKNRIIRDLQEELRDRDEEYEQFLKEQSERIQLLLERMEEQTRNLLRTYRRSLRQIEETFELERREMLENSRKRWDETIQAQNEQQLEFLRERTRKAEEFGKQLKELQEQDVENYDNMKLQLEKDVQYLERKLEEMKGIYHLNQVKLEYNLEVLRQQDLENSTLRSLQKRRITRLQTSLDTLRSKAEKQERKFQEEKQSLECDRRRIMEQHAETEKRMRQFSASSSEKFRKVWLVNEEEAKGLMRKALEADRIIHVQQLGMPWEEPSHWFPGNAGPPGERPERRTAMRAAREAMGGLGSGKGGQGNPGNAEDGDKPSGSVSRKTIRRLLELLRDESGFLTGKKLLEPLQVLEGQENKLLELQSILEVLGIEDEQDLLQLVDFFLKHKSREVTESQLPGFFPWEEAGSSRWECGGGKLIIQVSQDNPCGDGVPDSAEEGGSGSQRDDLPSSGSSGSSVCIRADDVLRILKEFLKDFDRMRKGPEVRDGSRDEEYWESLTRVIPEPTLKLWDALAAALLEYHQVLSRRSQLLSKACLLQQQNSELGILLEEYVRS
ncbi:DRC1 protein, partial [Pitta sordida]|nr:DRC1 protein [Pitta sordida]